MNDFDRWQEGNRHYLATAIAWLRLRLKRLAVQGPDVSGGSGSSPSPQSKSDSLSFFKCQHIESCPQTTDVNEKITETDIESAATRMAQAEAMDPPPSLIILSQRFGLSRFEREILLLCAAMELDTTIPAFCARAQNDLNRTYPTFALAFMLFGDPAWEAVSPERALRYWRLIEINQPTAQPLITSPLRTDERIVNYIKGLNYLDDRLSPLILPFEAEGGKATLPSSQQSAVNMCLQHLHQLQEGLLPSIIQLVGPDTFSKQLVAQQAAAALNLHLYRLPVEVLPTQSTELENLARLWQRESILLPIALYLDAHDHDGTSQPEGQVPPLHRLLVSSHGIFFLGTREIRPGLGPLTTVIEVDKPTPAEQQEVWREELGKNATESPALLAGQFNLNVATIRQVAGLAVSGSFEKSDNLHDGVWRACRVTTRPRLDLLAQRLQPKVMWDDIVLSKETETLLRQIADQVSQRSRVYDEWGFRQKMNRGFGISALFTGESGTGKTMAAEVIANELHLDLYRIDLSAVVSKYIGETEKNLRRLFDAAEDGGAILFFDEADALFGKRSEVKDSHDRYANIEINYLLQRMEAYRGLAILATNMKSALDQAFMRRLRFIVNFPFPGVAERKLIWHKVFPAQTPTEELDFNRLARLNLTGGGINNIAINAAFLAAGSQPPRVTMPLVLEAARTEFRKQEKPINEAEFRMMEVVGTKS